MAVRVTGTDEDTIILLAPRLWRAYAGERPNFDVSTSAAFARPAGRGRRRPCRASARAWRSSLMVDLRGASHHPPRLARGCTARRQLAPTPPACHGVTPAVLAGARTPAHPRHRARRHHRRPAADRRRRRPRSRRRQAPARPLDRRLVAICGAPHPGAHPGQRRARCSSPPRPRSRRPCATSTATSGRRSARRARRARRRWRRYDRGRRPGCASRARARATGLPPSSATS